MEKLIVYFLIVFTSLSVFADIDKLEQASKLISGGSYDQAIEILDLEIRNNPNSARGHLLIARAYHWKKDLGKAHEHYILAASLNPTYKFEIIPLLDELQEWNDIIDLVGPEVNQGNRDPSLLGNLATAYKESGKRSEAEKVIKLLLATNYEGSNDNDYKNYVLAYYYLWEDDFAKSKEHLRKIKSKNYLRYARTSPKFKKVFKDQEFIELTK